MDDYPYDIINKRSNKSFNYKITKSTNLLLILILQMDVFKVDLFLFLSFTVIFEELEFFQGTEIRMTKSHLIPYLSPSVIIDYFQTVLCFLKQMMT